METAEIVKTLIFLIAGGLCGYLIKNRESKSEIKLKDGRVDELERKAVRLETELTKERDSHEREVKTLKDAEQRLVKEFENTGGRIFDDKSRKFAEQNKEGLENILSPLKKDIKDFREKFEKTDNDFAGKFGELKNQVEQLSKLNKTIGDEAQNLTKALKGDSKQQGNWGEFVLEKTLEMSGLQEGREYEKQESFAADGGRQQVDVIVRLPDGKDIVIDSKVSIVSYERHCSSDNENERALFLKEHVASVENHIKELGEKNYQNISGIRSLNFVLMFVCPEPAYILAVKEKEEILQMALDKNVVLVCPSTLLAVLRTVQSLWQMEAQNTNARTIAEEAGKLYDKFAGFVGQMEKVDKQLNTVRGAFDDAYKSLSSGRGNLVRRAEKMKELGAKTSKSLPAGLVEQGHAESADEPGEAKLA